MKVKSVDEGFQSPDHFKFWPATSVMYPQQRAATICARYAMSKPRLLASAERRNSNRQQNNFQQAVSFCSVYAWVFKMTEYD
jgi:hypothetical protein